MTLNKVLPTILFLVLVIANVLSPNSDVRTPSIEHGLTDVTIGRTINDPTSGLELASDGDSGNGSGG